MFVRHFSQLIKPTSPKIVNSNGKFGGKKLDSQHQTKKNVFSTLREKKNSGHSDSCDSRVNPPSSYIVGPL
jgi:hypothetical protein